MMTKLLVAGFVGMIGVAVAPSAFAQCGGAPEYAPPPVQQTMPAPQMIPGVPMPQMMNVPQGLPVRIHVEVHGPGQAQAQPPVAYAPVAYAPAAPVMDDGDDEAMPQSAPAVPGEQLFQAVENTLLEHGVLTPEQHAHLSQTRAALIRHALHAAARLHHGRVPMMAPAAMPAPVSYPAPTAGIPVTIPISIPAIFPAV